MLPNEICDWLGDATELIEECYVDEDGDWVVFVQGITHRYYFTQAGEVLHDGELLDHWN